MLKPVPLFGLGVSGKSVNVNAQERLNLYCELQSDPETNTLAIYPTPGLVAESNYGSNPARGAYSMGDYKYFVVFGTLWREANDGTKTNLGTLLTTGGKVSMSDNGTQLIVVDGTYGYIWNTVTLAFAQIVSGGFPPSDTVTFMNGYFIVSKTGTAQFYISALYDGLTWDALDFATAESNPDRLIRVLANNGQLILFGDISAEFWGDSGAADFPFARIGGAAIEWGLAARWSLAKFDNSIIFLRKNRLGAVQVCVLNGFNASPVSTPELDYVISQYPAVSDAVGFAYMKSGHAFYQINFPTANASWLYDGQSNSWSRLESGGNRHRAELQIQYLDDSYVTDYENGLLYTLDENTYTDNGAQITRELICRHQPTGNVSKITQLWLQMESGVGLGGSHRLIAGEYQEDTELASFARASAARYLDDDGILQTAAVDIPRYQGGYLLVEDAATNLCLRSQTLETAPWTTSGSSILSNVATAPNGNLLADAIVESAGGGGHVVYQDIAVTTAVYTFSVYLKANTRTFAVIGDTSVNAMYFDLANGVISSTSGPGTPAIEAVGNGWYRCSVTSPEVAGTYSYAILIAQSNGVPIYVGDGVSSIYAWGAQLEIGQMTSHVAPATSGTPITRAADVAYVMDAAPQIMMQISRDGGHTWGSEQWRSLGAIGKYGVRAIWNSLGRSRDWLFRFKVTDPVKTVFIAAWAKYGG